MEAAIKHMFGLYIQSVIIRTLKNYLGNMFICEILWTGASMEPANEP